uniref:serine--tRNA ligase n=1 Tax=Albugo laibachii Nc14 TaxID=890382 RepID=F0WJ68_9STRA|nr:seryltRNA synthetase putative [Albugo laibachii Nc14]|eukprot:CCA21315.1 seryltRNA synthetase putative [Albugo laibachii Nc14]
MRLCGQRIQSFCHRASYSTVKPRLDYKKLTETLEEWVQNVRNRMCDANPERVVALYQHQRTLKTELNHLRARRNVFVQHVKSTKSQHVATTNDLSEEMQRNGKQLRETIICKEKKLEQVTSELELEAMNLPNDTHPNTPIGAEDASKLLVSYGQKPRFDFAVKDHSDLMHDLGLIDTISGAKVAGSKFIYLRNEAAMLEIALVQYTLQKLRHRGFEIVFPPDVAQSSLIEGCGFQPRGEATQIYSIADSDLCLTATSEITLAGMKTNEILPTNDLPLKYAAFSHCFRTEIGHGGRPTRGMYRIHQFSKVEMFAFCANVTQSEHFFQEMLTIQCEMYQELGLHFNVVEMATQELGAPAHRKLDILAWMPGRKEYGEISSLSYCTDYQARRLNIRHKANKKDSAAFVHTLNGTACAVPRLLIALFESYQQEDGSVRIPVVLQPFLGMQADIRRPSRSIEKAKIR